MSAEQIHSSLDSVLSDVRAATAPSPGLEAAVEVVVRWFQGEKAGLAPAHRAAWRASSWGGVGDGHTNYRAPRSAEARAAIEAMREPTEAMMEMAVFRGDMVAAYQSIIDAALSSAEQTERDSSRDELNPLPETPA